MYAIGKAIRPLFSQIGSQLFIMNDAQSMILDATILCVKFFRLISYSLMSYKVNIESMAISTEIMFLVVAL